MVMNNRARERLVDLITLSVIECIAISYDNLRGWDTHSSVNLFRSGGKESAGRRLGRKKQDLQQRAM